MRGDSLALTVLVAGGMAVTGCHSAQEARPPSPEARTPSLSSTSVAVPPLPAPAPTASAEPALARRRVPALQPSASPSNIAPIDGVPSPSVLPPPVRLPFERTARPSDGKWSTWPAGSQASFFRTLIHPGKFSRFAEMEVVAIDLRRFALEWRVGKGEEGAELLSSLGAPGLVAQQYRSSTRAVFNGGFLARHGRWGISASGIEIQPQKPQGCTVVLFEDGAVALDSWSELVRVHSTESLASATLRQTPPCLLSAGLIHPALKAGRTRRWAGANPNRKTRRRSALGLDGTGNWLYYAVGIETGPLELARGMAAVGAHSAAQLDINWSWARFFLTGPTEDGSTRELTEALREEMVRRGGEFFRRPSPRDFFYLRQR